MLDTLLLRGVRPFDQLSPDALDALAGSIGRRHVVPGEVLFHQGEVGDECFVILAGQLEVITFVGGDELRLDLYHPGQIVGEMALIDRSPRSATVRAVESSDLVVLGEEAFKTLLAANPELAMTLLRSGTTRVRNTNQRMIGDLERKNAELMAAYTQLQAAQADLIRLNRIEEELAVARRIQQSFLPRRLPQLPGWQLAAFSRGALAVGGDFFDCIELPDGRMGLIVADVCGKGVTAAMFVALTRSLIRAASQAPWIFQGEMRLDAESVLTGALWMVNDYICREHADSSMFITLFYGVLDTQTGALAYANAGHNPPLLVGPQPGEVVETEQGGLPLGIMPAQSYDVLRLTIAPGQRLVGFSDGITEAFNSAEELYGDERLRLALVEGHALSAQELVDNVVTQVDTFATGVPQADDMTLLVVTRLA